MQKFRAYMNVPTRPKRGTSLGLKTHTLFELELLEVAVKGSKAFEAFWDKEGANYDCDQKVMCHEILREIEAWENYGNMSLLKDRARKQVVSKKDHSTWHKRALVVYRDLLDLSRARQSTDYSNSQCLQRDSTEFTSSLTRKSREISISPQMKPVDKKWDLMLSIALPLTEEEESSTPKESGSRSLQGEPSVSCELIPNVDNASCDSISIFKMPDQTDEGGAYGELSAEILNELSLASENSEGGDSNCPLSNGGTPLSNVDTPCSPFTLKKNLTGEEPRGNYSWEDVEVKIDFRDVETTQVLGNFPGKDFKKPIEWKVDRIVYKATNMADLRRKHDIVIEGTFRKRCRGRNWRRYYGFVFDTGVMIYFRKEVYKKVADFRKSTISVPKGKKYRLNIKDVCVDSRETDWLMKLDGGEHFKRWYETLLKLSKALKNDIDGLQESLRSPKNQDIKLN